MEVFFLCIIMLYLLIIIFLFLVVVTYLGIKVEDPDHTKSNSIQVKSDLFNRLCREGLISKDKLIFTRGLHTVERSSVNP